MKKKKGEVRASRMSFEEVTKILQSGSFENLESSMQYLLASLPSHVLALVVQIPGKKGKTVSVSKKPSESELIWDMTDVVLRLETIEEKD